MAKVEKSKPPWDAAVAVICEENEASGDDLSDGISQLADSHLRSSHSVLVRLVRLVTHPSATNFPKERSSHAWKGRCQQWSISEAENQ